MRSKLWFELLLTKCLRGDSGLPGDLPPPPAVFAASPPFEALIGVKLLNANDRRPRPVDPFDEVECVEPQLDRSRACPCPPCGFCGGGERTGRIVILLAFPCAVSTSECKLNGSGADEEPRREERRRRGALDVVLIAIEKSRFRYGQRWS